MATVNVSAISGDSTPFVMRAEDLGSGTADSVSGKILALHNHDAIFKAEFDSLYGVGLTKNVLSSTVSASGDTQLVAAQGSGNRISIAWVRLANESATETTVELRSGSTEIFRSVLAPKSTAGASSTEMIFPAYFPLETAANAALNINLSGANTIGYSIGYQIRS